MRTVLLAVLVLVFLEGCATGPSRGALTVSWGLTSRSTPLLHAASPSREVVPPAAEELGGTGGSPEPDTDAFQAVQEASGLEQEAWHPAGAALYQAQARRLLGELTKAPLTQRSFAPRRVLAWLLREVLAGRERVEYADLRWRAERFVPLVLVRPDGYLVTALQGTPLQSMGPPRFVDLRWMVGGLEVGAFYFSREGVFYPVTEALRFAGGPPLAELGLGRDPLNAALDGAQDAMVEMAVALAQSIRHPIRTVEDLAQLPDGVARLIAASPEYFARYGAMSREDQIREAARLSTHVLMMLGGAAEASAGGLGGLGAELPMLSLSAEGEVVLGEAVAGGTVTAAGELGGLPVLHMAGRGPGSTGGGGGNSGTLAQAAPVKGPGRWTYKKPTTQSKASLDYQEQVTGRPAWWVYMVGLLEFDGFKAGALLEAKGPGYCAFFNADGTPKYWYVNSGKFREMMEQAEQQSKLARRLGVPLIWHVADAKVAEFLSKEFRERRFNNTTVSHTPAAH